MNISDQLKNHLSDIIDVARLAPSVHNTQPWQVNQSDDTLTVTIDPQHKLTDGDPTGRETGISLGIFCEAIDLAARGHELQVDAVTLRPRGGVVLNFSAATGALEPGLLELLQARSSDRSIYRPAEVPDSLVTKLVRCGTSLDATVHVSTEPTLRQQVADLTSRAIAVALSSPGFRRELSQYLVPQGSGKQRGIAAGSLYINPVIAWLQPFMLRHNINVGAEAKLEKRRWESASGLVLITAPGDMPKYWLDVGRAYLRVSLAIEGAGLSQTTSAAIVEASNYHEDIEETLGTNERLLAVIRTGNGAKKRRYSPRVSANELLT